MNRYTNTTNRRAFGWSPLPVIGLAFALAGWDGTAAQMDDAKTDAPVISGNLAGLSLEQLMAIPISTASRYEQLSSEAPSLVTVIHRNEIQEYGYRTMRDILNAAMSFYTTCDRNYLYAGMRGFSIAGDYNNRILLLIDGHRINDGVYDSAILGSDFPLDVDLIEKIEIVRGPSSSLYGNNAFFGVINVITRRGESFGGPEVSVDAGSQDTYQGRASFGQVYANGMELVVSGSSYTSDGEDRLFFPEFDDPETNNGIAEDRDSDEYESLFARLSWNDWTLQAIYIEREKEIPTASYETAFNAFEATVDRTFYSSLVYQHAFARAGDMEARVYVDVYEYEGDYPYDWPPIIYNDDTATAERYGVEAKYSQTLWDRHTLTVGGEFRDDYRQDQFNADREPEAFVYLDDHRNSDFWALYAQDEIRVTERIILQLGGRYDEYSIFGGTASPRFALVCDPAKRTTVKLLYGEAFRAPNVYELYYHDGDQTQKGNSDLEPETIETFEAIIEQYLTDQILLTVSGFRYDIEDLITQIEDPEDGLAVSRNSEPVTGEGVEVALRGRWSPGVATRASYSYQEATLDSTGEWLLNSPKHLAKLNLTVPLIDQKLRLGSEVQYGSERRTLADDRTEDVAVINLTLLSRPLDESLELSASVYNLFDERIEHPGGAEHLQDIIAQDGRQLRVKATYRF